jgi:aminoglycoside phosphotransferase
VVEFPEEPVMDWLVGPDGALSSHGEHARLRVLRYIPLRRVTFALDQAQGLPARVIAKTKRRRSILRAARALLGARRAVARDGADAFRVPPPVGLDARRRLLYLAELPGRSLSELLAAGQLHRDDALHRLGRVHRAVHELDVHRVPVPRHVDWLAATVTAADQIGILVPSVRGQVAAIVDRLGRTMPEDTDLVFCQGDFVPSQILCDASGWTVLDFDDAHHADPHAEAAALAVALGWELSHATPADADAARRAYLVGYCERAGRRLEPARWEWFVAVARVRYLARRLVKGRARPGEAAAVLDEVQTGRVEGLDALV